MKKLVVLLLSNFIWITAFCTDSSVVKRLRPHKINLFPLSDIRVTDPQFKHITDMDHQYLLSLDPDRLVSWQEQMASFTPM